MSGIRGSLTDQDDRDADAQRRRIGARLGDRHRARRPAGFQADERPARSSASIRHWRCSMSVTSTGSDSLRTAKAPARRTLCRLSRNCFDRAFVSFSLHHFGNSSGVVKEVMRVLKGGGRFVVLDPIIEEAKDAVDSRPRDQNQSSLSPHPWRRVSLSHGEQHPTSADQSRLSYSAHQCFVLLVQPRRDGRNSHRPPLARSGIGIGKGSAGARRAHEEKLFHLACAWRPCPREREFFLRGDHRGEARVAGGFVFKVPSFVFCGRLLGS